MIRLTLRRNRIRLPIWILAIALFWTVSASAISTEFGGDGVARRLLTAVALNPTILALRGSADGTSTAALVYFQAFAFLAVLAGLMNSVLATRGLRADEERGRLELVVATPVDRGAALRAVLVVGASADVLVAALSAAALAGLGFDPAGAVLAGAATGAVGLAFLGLAVLANQVMPTGRSANALGVTLVGAAYLLRALGDALGSTPVDTLVTRPAWPSWLSPIGWAQRVSPFNAQDPRPLLLLLGLAALSGVAAVLIQRRRDLGASILPERVGRARAHAYLRGPAGLLWRQNWPALIAWVITGALFGAIAGSLSGALQDAVKSTAGVAGVLGSLAGGASGTLTDTFVVAILAMAGLVAAVAGLQTLLRMRGEEADGRAELLLAAPVTRTGWLLGSLALAALSAALVALSAGLAAGLSFVATGEPGRLGSSVVGGLAQLPMVTSFLGIAALAVALLPRAATAISWGALALAWVLGPLGGILRLTQWLRELSPFQHSPQIPGPDPDWGPALIVLAVGVALAAVATVAMTRRQVTT